MVVKIKSPQILKIKLPQGTTGIIKLPVGNYIAPEVLEIASVKIVGAKK